MPLSRETVFLMYALAQARQAIDALNLVTELCGRIEHPAPGVERREHQSVWNAIRTGLHLSAGVSRVFWPSALRKVSRARAMERAESLCNLTGLPVSPRDHVLGKRAWRDYVEHLDERLDTLLADREVDFVFTEHIAYYGRNTDVEANTMLLFDPETRELNFQSEVYTIDELITGLEDVLAACSRAARALHAVNTDTPATRAP